MLIVAVLSDALTVSEMVRHADDFRRSGAAVATLASPAGIDGEACEALSGVPDVLAAGALRVEKPVTMTTLPASPLEHFETTPGLARVLEATEDGHGVYVSRDVASTLGAHGLPLADGVVPVRGVYDYPADGRRPGFGWAMLSPTTATVQPFDECWVLTWPQRLDTRHLLLTTLDPGGDFDGEKQPHLAQLNAKYGEVFTGTDRFRSRSTQYAPQYVFGAAMLLGFASILLRRVELASNLHAGMERAKLMAMMVTEVFAWAVPAIAAAWMAGVVVAALTTPAELGSMSFRAGQIALAFLPGSMLGAVVGVSSIRERLLWRYVRSR